MGLANNVMQRLTLPVQPRSDSDPKSSSRAGAADGLVLGAPLVHSERQQRRSVAPQRTVASAFARLYIAASVSPRSLLRSRESESTAAVHRRLNSKSCKPTATQCPRRKTTGGPPVECGGGSPASRTSGREDRPAPAARRQPIERFPAAVVPVRCWRLRCFVAVASLAGDSFVSVYL
jgi:hypothetical protein